MYVIYVRKVKHVSGFMPPLLTSVYETIMRFGTQDMDCFLKMAKTAGRYTSWGWNDKGLSCICSSNKCLWNWLKFLDDRIIW